MSLFTRFDATMQIQYDDRASRALGADHWRVTQGFRFYVGSLGSDEWFTVPAGYLTDGMSAPRIAWSLVPPWGRGGQAAVGHDLLCEYLSTVKAGRIMLITRKRADRIFLEMLTVLDVPERQWIYAAVRGYAVAKRIKDPSTIALKRQLEAEWIDATVRET